MNRLQTFTKENICMTSDFFLQRSCEFIQDLINVILNHSIHQKSQVSQQIKLH